MDIPKIIKTKHRTKWQTAVWDEITNHLTAAKSKKDFKQILSKLLSSNEKRAIINRVAVLALVKAGKSYSEIGNILWTSPVTISTIKKNFLDQSEHYKSRRLMSGKKKRGGGKIDIKKSSPFWEELLETVEVLAETAGEFLGAGYRGIGITKAWDIKKYRHKFK